uniref:NACHT domain-containing protein n=1 Tax=Bubo bubo TaxID=30461 RepID=A0A8C0F6B0_BUBBB
MGVPGCGETLTGFEQPLNTGFILKYIKSTKIQRISRWYKFNLLLFFFKFSYAVRKEENDNCANKPTVCGSFTILTVYLAITFMSLLYFHPPGSSIMHFWSFSINKFHFSLKDLPSFACCLQQCNEREVSRYMKMVMFMNPLGRSGQEHEVLGLKESHAEVRREDSQPAVTVETLFWPDERGQTPQIIVLVGGAGIGKIVTARKIMLDRAREAINAQFDYAFFINCSEINLSQQTPPEAILATPEKLLFIIDGFDEMRFSLDQKPVEIILSSLFQKTLLSQSSLLITTRPTALQSLGKCLKGEYYAEIMGFSDAEKEAYFFRDEEKAIKAITFVKRNDTLFAMCLVPIMCWTICTVLEQALNEGKDVVRTSRTTELYVLYLSSLLKCGSESLKQDMKMLSRLCCMAADGIWKWKILFHEKLIEVYGLNHPVLLFLFLHDGALRNCMKCVSACNFLHLSFQEFFAALFYALEDNEETEELEMLGKDIKKVLEKYSEYYTNWILVVQFLFGLLNEEAREYLIEIIWCTISPRVKKDLFKLIQICQGTTLCSGGVIHNLNVFHWFEIQEETFVSNVLDCFTGIVLKESILS